MEIIRSDDDTVARLALVGDFDTMDVPQFEAHVGDAVSNDLFNLLLNAEGMRLINSSAIQSLLRTQILLSESGGSIAVAGLSPFATSVFETLGIDRRIRCFASDEEARAWLVSE